MQTASSNFAAAVSASSGVWAPPQVHTDWDGGGYSGDNSIDDLSPLVGRPITIQQGLDDGMPSDVTATSGRDSTSKADMPVGGRTVSGTVFSGPQYWSVDNTASPIATFDRDVAAFTVSAGLVTSGGIERVTVFTGRMMDVAVTGRSATLSAQSATRLRMTKAVQPPPIIGDWLGLDATWPVSWSLYQCGIYVSPPPRSGCRLWMPMHGSAQPFLPAVGRKQTDTIGGDLATGAKNRPTFTDGPYLAAADLGATYANAARLTWSGVAVAAGTDLLTTTANAGRIEMWVRGDSTDSAVDVNAGASFVVVSVAPFGATPVAKGGVTSGRKVFINVNDNAGHNVTLSSSASLPNDGNWYFVGAAYDVAGKKLWVVNNFSGSNVVETQNASTLVTTGLPATEDYNPDSLSGEVGLFACLPIAEVHLTAGAQANPDTTVWLNDASYAASWSSGAVLRRSQLDLVALAETKPREAWEFISSFAQAELAMVRTDELDRFCYLPMSYWAETAQQTVADTWSTAVNADGNFSITRDPTKVRNEVTVTFTDSRIGDWLTASRDKVFLGFTVYTLPPGVATTITLPFQSPVVSVEYLGDPFHISDSTTTFSRNFLCANTASDGSGTYASSTSQISATITDWNAGQCVVTVRNLTSITYYIVSNGTAPAISISGTFLIQSSNPSVVASDSASIAARGVRGMTVNLPAIQDATWATTIANELLARLSKPQPQLRVKLRGDPRRQPGDWATFADPNNTGASGSWRSMSVDTTVDGADVTQDVTAVKALPVGVWGESNWGECIWGA